MLSAGYEGQTCFLPEVEQRKAGQLSAVISIAVRQIKRLKRRTDYRYPEANPLFIQPPVELVMKIRLLILQAKSLSSGVKTPFANTF